MENLCNAVVLRKLVEQGNLSKAEGKKLIGKSPVGEGAVTIDDILSERDKAKEKADGQEPEAEPDQAEPEGIPPPLMGGG
ncbi:MAG: hypothetical protein KF784_00765 [Fimbriimonadaceae bacterium]|nr:hypothetical protein [Fimbriimonadaceae bacterium]